MGKGKLYIGTSGWAYPHWQSTFYPEGLPKSKWLEYFSRYFNTVEINYSFYHLPSQGSFSRWYTQTPDNFVFAVKLSRFITHIKRLKGVKSALRIFLGRAVSLKDKLGPILVQFPPNFSRNEVNQTRLKEFLSQAVDIEKNKLYHSRMRLALEFRDSSWFNSDIYKLLTKFKSALVISDSSTFPKEERVTTDFIYIRMHGPTSLFSSDYSPSQLKALAKKIKKWLKKKLDVFCYFNNDFSGFAVKDAQGLVNLLGR